MGFEYLRIGKIVNTHGIKGEIRVLPLTDDIGRFKNLKSIQLDDDRHTKVDIESVKYQNNFVLIKLKDINSINDAEKFKNVYIVVDRSNAIKLPEGSFFICDLIDIEVYDLNKVFLGKIIDILSTGSNDVYVVKDGNKEILIPALKTVVKEINIQEGKIIVELPEGLV